MEAIMIETGVPLNTEVGRNEHNQQIKVVSDHDFFQTLNETGFLLGCLIGCFIQFSSLGAIYILTQTFGHNATPGGRYQEFVLSTIWSLVSSSMAFLILAFVKSAMTYMTRDYNDSKSKNQHEQRVTGKLHAQIFGQLEYTFSIGILSGACVSWTVTDFFLGLDCHAFISTVCILLCVTGCKMLLERCRCCDDVADDNKVISYDKINLSEPLLLQGDQKSSLGAINARNNSVNNDGCWISPFKIKIIIVGSLVGIFIQLCTMGVEIVLGGMSTSQGGSSDHRETDHQDWILLLTLMWSLFFGSLGIIVLWVIRNLVAMVWQWRITTTIHTTDSFVNYHDDVEKAVTILEDYGAFGCLVGVNVAWATIMTNSSLGQQISVRLLVLIFGTALMIWFKLKSCLIFHLCPTSTRNQDDHDPSGQDSTLIIKDILIV